MKINIPKSGEVWRHYKHDPAIENSYTYRIEAIGLCTDNTGERLMVVYRPLYTLGKKEQEEGVEVFVRNLEEFMGKVEVNANTTPRFTKIS